jgi:hypothetical protein
MEWDATLAERVPLVVDRVGFPTDFLQGYSRVDAVNELLDRITRLGRPAPLFRERSAFAVSGHQHG